LDEEGLDGIESDVYGEDKKADTHQLEGNLLAALVMSWRG
jgi:hypothetical protein